MNQRDCKAALLFGAGISAAMFASAALGYVGPGAGLGVLGALLALLAAILATVVGLVLWPLRALARRRKAKREVGAAPAPADAASQMKKPGGS